VNRRADRPVMFRAGGEVRGIPALTAGPVTYLADLSEWNPQIDDAVYLAWSKAVAIRGAYGDQHDDNAWYGGARRDALHAGGVKVLFIYQYIVAGQDAAAQAHALVRLVGKLRPGEKLIADMEEGDGDQGIRWRQWCAVLAAAYGTADGADPWLYSGLDFAATHGLKPEWVAAYQGSEPASPHLLWQFTPAFPVPGVGLADANVYHGTVDQLAAYAYQPAPHPHPAPPPAQEDDVQSGQLNSGTGAVTVITVPQGSARTVAFGCDNDLQGLPPAKLRVAIFDTQWHISPDVVVDSAKGQAVLVFGDKAKTGVISVRREDAGDAVVGWQVS
jgi:hypothetical protein